MLQKDETPKAVLSPPPPVSGIGERKSFDGMRPEYVIAQPEKKKGFFGNLMSRNPLSRHSSPAKTAPSTAVLVPPSSTPTVDKVGEAPRVSTERQSADRPRSAERERGSRDKDKDKDAPHIEVSAPATSV